MTGSQAHQWPRKYFTPAVRKVAEKWPEDHGEIIGATPYSLRRGMISLRIRAGEDRQAVAKQCGTSVDMLERNYSFAIEDLEDGGFWFCIYFVQRIARWETFYRFNKNPKHLH